MAGKRAQLLPKQTSFLQPSSLKTSLNFGFDSENCISQCEWNLIVDVPWLLLSWSRSNDWVRSVIHHDQRTRANNQAHIENAANLLRLVGGDCGIIDGIHREETLSWIARTDPE
jgi:hypothetical protein